MFNKEFNKIWLILGVVALLTAFFIFLSYKGISNLIINDGNKLAVVAGAKIIDEVVPDNLSDTDLEARVKGKSVAVVDNDYFQARIGTYWIYEGNGSKLGDDNNIFSYKIKLKYEVASISFKDKYYLITLKTTNLLDSSVKEGTIRVGKDYLVYRLDGFYGYVRFPMKVGNRWEESFSEEDSAIAEPLRDDGYYQNKINWQLDKKILGNNCFGIENLALSSSDEMIWCNNIGLLQDKYHHNGSADDSMIRLVKYHY